MLFGSLCYDLTKKDAFKKLLKDQFYTILAFLPLMFVDFLSNDALIKKY